MLLIAHSTIWWTGKPIPFFILWFLNRKIKNDWSRFHDSFLIATWQIYKRLSWLDMSELSLNGCSYVWGNLLWLGCGRLILAIWWFIIFLDSWGAGVFCCYYGVAWMSTFYQRRSENTRKINKSYQSLVIPTKNR